MTVKNIDLNATIIIYDTLERAVESFINNQTNLYATYVESLTKGMYFMNIDNRQPIQFIKN